MLTDVYIKIINEKMNMEFWMAGFLVIPKVYAVIASPFNKPLIHTSLTYPKLNMDGFSVLDGSLGYQDSTQEVEFPPCIALITLLKRPVLTMFKYLTVALNYPVVVFSD